MEGLILPLLHRVQRGLYQQGMPAFGLCGGNMALFIDQHMQNSIALKLALFYQPRILRFYSVDQLLFGPLGGYHGPPEFGPRGVDRGGKFCG